MAETTKVTGLVGLFKDSDALLRTARQMRDAGWKRWDCYTPFPMHGLDKAMGIKDSFMPYVTLTAAFTGATSAKLMQWWMSAYDYPLIIGGTPLFALPAFAPVTFELFVLFAALATFFTIIIACKLLRWHSPLHDAGIMSKITSDHFAIYLDASDNLFSVEDVRKTLEANDCDEIHVLQEENPEKDAGAK